MIEASVFAIILLFLIPLALWIWALIDAIRSPFESDIAKLLVIVLMFWLPILGPILYFIFKRRILNLS